MEPPRNKQQLQRFLEMVNFLHKFISNISQVTYPLRMLLKNDTLWSWNENQQTSFLRLKELIGQAPVLRIFDPKLEVTVQTDASKFGLECCLLQEGQPVAFRSRSLKPAELNYPITEKEMLGIIFECEYFDKFIYGHKIKV